MIKWLKFLGCLAGMAVVAVLMIYNMTYHGEAWQALLFNSFRIVLVLYWQNLIFGLAFGVFAIASLFVMPDEENHGRGR